MTLPCSVLFPVSSSTVSVTAIRLPAISEAAQCNLKNVVIIAGTPAFSIHGPSGLKEPYRFTIRLRDSSGTA
jgi:hypothetical protein